jgi:hypothetical protein
MSNPDAAGGSAAKRALGMAEKLRVWMVNEGKLNDAKRLGC